jgi:hypothetical protein
LYRNGFWAMPCKRKRGHRRTQKVTVRAPYRAGHHDRRRPFLRAQNSGYLSCRSASGRPVAVVVGGAGWRCDRAGLVDSARLGLIASSAPHHRLNLLTTDASLV